MTSSPGVRLRGAAFGYDAEPVVTDVDLAIGPGSFVGVLGPNGSGKTTILRGVLGLLEPLRGTVVREGVHFGYVPQRESLDPVFPLTVEEVVHMGAYGRLSGTRRLSAAERDFAAGCLERVGLLRRRAEAFASLSGGQRQRALLARALMMRPNLLVLDEPTSGVDQRTQDLVLELLTALNREDELAILLVSHQLSMTKTVREVLWVAGGLARIGPPEEMLGETAFVDLFGIAGTLGGER